jgi:outer membrane murein-binding lipoprotein Lpp
VPGPEESATPKAIRTARFDLNSALIVVAIAGGAVTGAGGKSKLDSIDDSVRRVDGKLEHLETEFVELRTRVAATEKLELNDRLRRLEELGASRRLEKIESEVEQLKKGR